jgi:hypothetical protein
VTSALGAPRSKSGGYSCYPKSGQQGIPSEVQVSELGPELEAVLDKNGKAGLKVVGYPLTLHFGGTGVPGNRLTYACKLSCRGKDIPGVVMMDGGKIRQTAAPGMVTFYPLEPLPHGDIDFVWTWEGDDGPKRLSGTFKTK